MLRFASYQNQRDRSPVVTLFFFGYLMKWPTAGSGRSLSDFFTKTGATLVIILEMLCIDLRSDREAGVPMCENDKNISAMFGDGFMFFFFLLVEFWILKNFCLSCCFQSPGIYRDHELYLNCSPWKAWVCWACSWCQTGGSVTFSLSAPGFVRLELNLSFVKHEIRCLILNEHVWSRTISDGCFADVATRT